MNICDDGHDEIVYNPMGKLPVARGDRCPACNLVEQVHDKDDEIAELQQEIEDLQGERGDEDAEDDVNPLS